MDRPAQLTLRLLPITQSGRAEAAVAGAASDSPEPRRLDLVPDQASVERWRRHRLRSSASVLQPGVRTLRQAVDGVLAATPGATRTLSPLQQQTLAAEVHAAADRAGRLRHYRQPANPARLAEQLSRAFAQIAAHCPRDETGRPTWSPPSNAAADRELASLFQSYQSELRRRDLLDAGGRLALAASLLASGDWGALPRVELVQTNGLRSLTPVERRFLFALGHAAGRLVISLPWATNESPPLEELPLPSEPASPWAVVRRLACGLADGFDSVDVDMVDAETLDAEAIGREPADEAGQRLADWLFQDPRQAPPAPATPSGRYALITAESPLEEMRAVVAEVKKLLKGGTPARDIVLATRRVGDAASHAEQAFAEAGVPLAVAHRQTLVDAPLFRTLETLGRLAANDWPRGELLSLVTSPALRAFEQPPKPTKRWAAQLRAAGFAGPRAATEWLVHELQLTGGREAWRKVAADASRAGERRGIAAGAGLHALETLDRAAAGWRRSAKPLEWFDRLRRAATQLGYHSGYGSRKNEPGENEAAGDDTRLALADAAALESLETALADLERLAGWRGKSAPRLALSEVAELLAAWGASLPIQLGESDEGRVRLVPVETARSLAPRRLYLIGMGEQAFPLPPPGAGPLRRTLDEHLSQEMLLFAELCQAASERVTFSYASIDAKGQPLTPSSYVTEVASLVPLATNDAGSKATNVSAAGLRRAAVRTLNNGDATPLAAARLSPAGRPLLSGIRVALGRAAGDHFGQAEGVLLGEAAKQSLAAKFNADYHWSPTQLETYAACPFKFFAERVLRVTPLEDFDLRVDYRRRGSLLHDAMVELHSRLKDAGDTLEAIRGLDDDAFLAAFDEAIQSARRSLPPAPHEAALAEVEARQATGWGAGYREQWRAYADSDDSRHGALRPAYFEARFGPRKSTGGAAAEPESDQAAPSRPEPFALDIGRETILLTGQVDRIDLGAINGQPVFNVVDYKTANSVTARADELPSGRQLQLFLYTLATEQHLLAETGARPWRLGYWAVRNDGFKQPKEGKQPLHPSELVEGRLVAGDEWRAYDTAVRQRIAEIIGGVRRGDFPMFNADEHCGRTCEFRTACRVGQTRSLGKTPADSTRGQASEQDSDSVPTAEPLQ